MRQTKCEIIANTCSSHSCSLMLAHRRWDRQSERLKQHTVRMQSCWAESTGPTGSLSLVFRSEIPVTTSLITLENKLHTFVALAFFSSKGEESDKRGQLEGQERQTERVCMFVCGWRGGGEGGARERLQPVYRILAIGPYIYNTQTTKYKT